MMHLIKDNLYYAGSAKVANMIRGVTMQVKDFLVRLVEWNRLSMKARSKV